MEGGAPQRTSVGKPGPKDRKVILQMMLSLDGFIAGPNDEVDWFSWNDEMAKHSLKLAKSVDTILLGRVAYEEFAKYWPTPQAYKENPEIAPIMHQLEKVVFSTTLNNVGWNNSRLAKGDIAEEILRMKGLRGKDIVMYGGAGIAQTFMKLGLFDEYRFFVNPIVLGRGKALFKNVDNRVSMRLIETKKFGNGVVKLSYVPSVKGP